MIDVNEIFQYILKKRYIYTSNGSYLSYAQNYQESTIFLRVSLTRLKPASCEVSFAKMHAYLIL